MSESFPTQAENNTDLPEGCGQTERGIKYVELPGDVWEDWEGRTGYSAEMKAEFENANRLSAAEALEWKASKSSSGGVDMISPETGQMAHISDEQASFLGLTPED